jgi:hypothetical protein
MLRCSYTFPDGRSCRSLARRHTSLCRHHTAQALEERADRARRAEPPLPDTSVPPPRSEFTSFWRGYHRVIRRSDESEFDEILVDLMDALDRGDISDRSAGRLLHTLVQRRSQLHQQRLDEKLILLAEQHAALRQSGISAKGLNEILVPQVRELMGLNAQKATR